MDIATEADEARVANTDAKTPQEKHTREAGEDAERLAKELALALKRGLIPIRPTAQIGDQTYAIVQAHRSEGFVLGGVAPIPWRSTRTGPSAG